MKTVNITFQIPDDVWLDQCSLTFYQEPDCAGGLDEGYQALKIKTVSNGASNFCRIKSGLWSSDGDGGSLVWIDQVAKTICDVTNKKQEYHA